MKITSQLQRRFITLSAARSCRGFSLIELMVAITISLILLIALLTVFVNLSRNNNELAKTSIQIENGRLAMQILQDDILHAGFWSGYVPQFDDLTSRATPLLTSSPGGSVPATIPDPCLEFSVANWTAEYRGNLLGIPVQGSDTVPASCAAALPNQQANADMLVVRHADTCVATDPATPNCEARVAGNLYMQNSLCSSTVVEADANTIKLASNSSPTSDAYVGRTVRITAGTGEGQSRTIIAYDGSTKVATVSPGWETEKVPDNTSTYTLDAANHVFDTDGLNLTARNCTAPADVRKFVSNIYYIRDFAVAAGDGIPTLMRSQFGLAGNPAVLAQQAAVPLIEGIEAFQVEFGIDNISDSGDPVNNLAAVVWADEEELTSPTNRGDGIPDQYIRCTAAMPCTAADLSNVVAVKVYVLARSREATPGYINNKTYTLGTTTLGPFNDRFKRQVFASTVRLNNVAGRRETP